MRIERQHGAVRANALWGRRGGEERHARRSRVRLVISTIAVFALGVPLIAAAAAPDNSSRASATAHAPVVLPASLLKSARSNPNATFRVIVQGSRTSSAGAAGRVAAVRTANPGKAKGVTRRFATLAGVAADVTGKQLVALARDPHVAAITRDQRIRMAGFSNSQQWPYQSQLSKFWDQIQTTGVQAPTVAVVDTGVDATRSDFGGRVVKQVTLTGLTPNSAGDGRGHGTFVAGILAGAQSGYAGGAPNAKIVSLDVMDDNGMALTSDVIAAADWIYRNKDAYGIRVANFSLHSSTTSSFMYDPLDKAVEKLWFSGVVVVAAAGNYGVAGQPSGVLFAPGNDPFVITAGASDIEGTIASNDDVNAPWSAYGYTPDGFVKPDVGAPGRYMIGPVPPTATLVAEKPTNVVSTGYMQLSGTSFAAPVVAAAAEYVLAMHPTWTPDQVKGALMVSATPTPSAAAKSLGVGEVKAQAAANVTAPPNPNKALDAFLQADPNGGSTPVFNAVSWSDAAKANPAWDAVSWSDSAWSSAAWSTVSWSDVSWSDSSWASVSWSDGTSTTASADVSWCDNAFNDLLRGGYRMSAADYLATK